MSARDSFLDIVRDSVPGISDADADRVYQYYRDHKLIKVDIIANAWTVPHGALLDAATLRRCADLVRVEA